MVLSHFNRANVLGEPSLVLPLEVYLFDCEVHDTSCRKT